MKFRRDEPREPEAETLARIQVADSWTVLEELVRWCEVLHVEDLSTVDNAWVTRGRMLLEAHRVTEEIGTKR